MNESEVKFSRITKYTFFKRLNIIGASEITPLGGYGNLKLLLYKKRKKKKNQVLSSLLINKVQKWLIKNLANSLFLFYVWPHK